MVVVSGQGFGTGCPRFLGKCITFQNYGCGGRVSVIFSPPLNEKTYHQMGSLKKRRKAKIAKHKRRKRMKENRHKKRLRYKS